MFLVSIFTIVAIYLALVFLIPSLFFPNFLLIKPKAILTNKIKRIAKKLKAKTKEETSKKVFDYVANEYSSEKYKLLILPYKHFYHNPDKFVDKKQFLPCHVQGLVFRTLLLATGQFSEDDLKKKITMTSFGVIHQYYLIKIKNKTFKADPFFHEYHLIIVKDADVFPFCALTIEGETHILWGITCVSHYRA